MLAQLIRKDENVKGIVIENETYKTSLFADDATCILSDLDSVGYIFIITERFSKYSGLNINIEKSQLVFIGPWRIKPNVPYEVEIIEASFNMLGIYLGSDKIECNNKNIIEKTKRMSTKLNIWSLRGMTILGKVLISKSMGISNIVYSLSCVSSKDNDIDKAQTIVNKFIWSNKPVKIKHTALIASFDNAGINSTDLHTMKRSLRLAWIGRLWKKKMQ